MRKAESVPASPHHLITSSLYHAVDWAPYQRRIADAELVQVTGRVMQVVGLVVESEGPAAHLGDICSIHGRREDAPVRAEVVGFRQQRLLLMPLGELGPVGQGSSVTNSRRALSVPVGSGWKASSRS